MIFALSLAAATATADIGLKSYSLGSSIDSFKEQSLPAGKYGPVRPMCSDMPEHKTWLAPALPESVACSFEQQIGSSWVRDDLGLSPEVSATVSFHYFAGKLAMIESYLDETRSSIVGESLVTRFGKPTSVSTKPVQVRSGASFPQTTTVWVLGSKTVTMKVPDLTLERMSVTYIDTPAVAQANSLHKRANIM